MSRYPQPPSDSRGWTAPTHGALGGQRYPDATHSMPPYPYGSEAVYNPAPAHHISPHQTSPPQHQFYSMSSSAPSHQNIPSSQTPVDPRAAKRAKTSPTSPSSGYPAPFATPSPMTPQSQAAAAAAAEAHRLRTGQLPAAGGFVHPPTDLPPRPYGGGSTSSPYTSPPKPPGKITGSQMQYLPDIEARLNRLESAVDKYVEIRGQKAVENSKLPGAGQQPGQQPTRK